MVLIAMMQLSMMADEQPFMSLSSGSSMKDHSITHCTPRGDSIAEAHRLLVSPAPVHCHLDGVSHRGPRVGWYSSASRRKHTGVMLSSQNVGCTLAAVRMRRSAIIPMLAPLLFHPRVSVVA